MRTTPNPVRAAVVVTALAYVTLSVVMLAIGLLLTHTLDGSIGRWDEHVNRSLAAHRTNGWDAVTSAATWIVNTLQVVAAAAVVVAFLAWRRRWREALFLTIALTLEITVFLSVTFVVARPRPSVPRLNDTPSTSSFPSGHTAAATVLFVGIALIVACCTRNTLLRAVGVVLALAVAVTVGFGRVYRGLHHPTDVFVGGVFGVACLLAAALAVRAASAEVARRENDVREAGAAPARLRDTRVAS